MGQNHDRVPAPESPPDFQQLIRDADAGRTDNFTGEDWKAVRDIRRQASLIRKGRHPSRTARHLHTALLVAMTVLVMMMAAAAVWRPDLLPDPDAFGGPIQDFG